MKAHQLARMLLNSPDVEVLVTFDDAPEYAQGVSYDKVESRVPPYGGEPDSVVILSYSNDGNVWTRPEE